MLLYWVCIYLGLLALLDVLILLPLCNARKDIFFNCLFFFIFVGLKSRIATTAFICLVNFPPSLYFEPLCVFAHQVGLLNTAYQWVLLLYPICQSVPFNRAFIPFTYKVDIVVCEFDPVIMMLGVYFVH